MRRTIGAAAVAVSMVFAANAGAAWNVTGASVYNGGRRCSSTSRW